MMQDVQDVSNHSREQADAVLDMGEAACGALIMTIFDRIGALAPGQTLAVRAYDRGAFEEVSAWCRMTGHALLSAQPGQPGSASLFLIRKKMS